MSIFGISHLVAISGFHLGFLVLFFYFLVKPIYQFFQTKLFPYRNRKFDLSIIAIVLLYLYLLLIEFTPSFLRSFAMFLFGLFLYFRAIKIVSFLNLLIVTLFLIALFPKLLLSLSLFLSVAGVFYIFLFLHHFPNFSKIKTVIFLNIFLFISMLIYSVYFFKIIAISQLLSPIITIAFSIFYPVELFLHFFNIGGTLDFTLDFLKTKFETVSVEIPLYIFLSYIFLSIISIFHKYIFYLFLATLAILFKRYLYYLTIL